MLFVAEIGLAYELIRQAKLAGADVAKFQFGLRDKPGEINCLDAEAARRLRRWCDYWGIEMFASVITEAALALARAAGLRRYKIASRTVRDNPNLCRKIIAEGKEMFVSLRMWEGDEFPFGKPHERQWYVFCRSKYPAYPEGLVGMPDAFGRDGYYGYSDHLHGIEGCLLAVARGARYVEKHSTLNRTSPVIHDHVRSATPAKFAHLSTHDRALTRFAAVVRRV